MTTQEIKLLRLSTGTPRPAGESPSEHAARVARERAAMEQFRANMAAARAAATCPTCSRYWPGRVFDAPQPQPDSEG